MASVGDDQPLADVDPAGINDVIGLDNSLDRRAVALGNGGAACTGVINAAWAAISIAITRKVILALS